MTIRDEVLGGWYIEATWKKFNVHYGESPKVEHSANTLNDAVAYIFEKRLAQITDTVTLQQYNQKIKDLDAQFQAAFKLKEEPVVVEKYQHMIPVPQEIVESEEVPNVSNEQ